MQYLESVLCRLYTMTTGRDVSRKNIPSLYGYVFIVSVLVYIQALVLPVLGLDTYTYFLSHGAGDARFDIIRGTWGFALVNQLAPGPLVSPLVSMLAFLVFTSWTLTTTALFWNRESADWTTGFLALTMTLFPYWASQAYFGYYHYGYSLATLAGVCAVLLAWNGHGWKRFAAAAVCTAIGASMYQGSLSIATSFAAATVVITWVRAAASGGPPACWKPLVRVIASMAVGAILYLGLQKLVMAALAMPVVDGSYTVDFKWNLDGALQSFRDIVPGNRWLFPFPARCILFFAGLLFVGAVLLRAGRGTPLRWLAVLPLLVLLFVSPLPLALLQRHILAPRSLGGVAFIWGAVVWGAMFLAGNRLKKALTAALAALLVIFAVQINDAWFRQRLTTESDLDNARRMHQRIVSLPEYRRMPRPVTVTFVGCRAASALPWPQDLDSVFGVSQFACFGGGNLVPHTWAVMRFAGAPMKVAPAGAGDLVLVAGREPWPADEAVFADGDRAIVWLGPPDPVQSTPERRLGLFALALGVRDKAASPPAALPSRWPFPIAQAGPGPWKAEGPLRTVSGNCDAREPVPRDSRFERVHGWAFDQGFKVLPPYVVLLDATGDIVGFAATGAPREDLRRTVAVDAVFAGFDGYILAGARCARIAYLLP